MFLESSVTAVCVCVCVLYLHVCEMYACIWVLMDVEAGGRCQESYLVPFPPNSLSRGLSTIPEACRCGWSLASLLWGVCLELQQGSRAHPAF